MYILRINRQPTFSTLEQVDSIERTTILSQDLTQLKITTLFPFLMHWTFANFGGIPMGTYIHKFNIN